MKANRSMALNKRFYSQLTYFIYFSFKLTSSCFFVLGVQPKAGTAAAAVLRSEGIAGAPQYT